MDTRETARDPRVRYARYAYSRSRNYHSRNAENRRIAQFGNSKPIETHESGMCATRITVPEITVKIIHVTPERRAQRPRVSIRETPTPE